MPSDYITVQYCPCGCVGRRSRNDLELLASKQLADIASGKKLDAVILPTSECGTCQCESQMRNEALAEMLEGWASLD